MFVKDGALHLVRGSDMWSIKSVEGKEPRDWPKIHFANVGVSEEFIELFFELMELMEMTTIYGPEREAVKDTIRNILVDGLMHAFESLRQIRQTVITPVAELNRRKLYESFARELWHAYKDLMPKAALQLGFDIGFQFQDDASFEKGIAGFNNSYPSLIMDIPGVLKRQREGWQQGLHLFRNDFLEHCKQDIKAFESYYRPEKAEMLFEHAWRTMADLFPVFIEARFLPTNSIGEIPVAERNPNRRRRWLIGFCPAVNRTLNEFTQRAESKQVR